MGSNNLPKMADEQRKVVLKRSVEVRRGRMEFKGVVKTGEILLADALADDHTERICVHKLLMCTPDIGKAKTDDIMRRPGITESRRVQSLGN